MLHHLARLVLSFLPFTSIVLMQQTVKELSPPRNSLHEYQHHEDTPMTYQAARAACEFTAIRLDMPVLAPYEIHYRWTGLFENTILEYWYWIPIQRDGTATWRWQNNSLVEKNENTAALIDLPASSPLTCAVWKLNHTFLPVSCEERHRFLCLTTSSEFCRLRRYNATDFPTTAIDWSGYNYSEFDSLLDAINHSVTAATPVLHGVKMNWHCKDYCDDIHRNNTLAVGCWFAQYYQDSESDKSRPKRCVLLLAPSFPSMLYRFSHSNGTTFFFRTCFWQILPPNNCTLNCACTGLTAPSNIEEAEAEYKKIKTELTLLTANLSATIRRKTSAHDPRPSAEAVGWLGVTCVIAFILSIVVLDLSALKRDLSLLKSNCQHLLAAKKKD